MEKKAVCRL